MLLHVCRCGKIIPQTMVRCEACEKEKKQRHIDYNLHRRDGKTAAFYVSKEWQRTRGHVLSMHSGLDLYAYHVLHEIRRAEMVHHIVELKEDWDRRIDVTNLIPLSERSHRAIHALYDSDAATKAATQATLSRIVSEAMSRVGWSELF